MVEGVVNARLEAVLSLSLSGPSGRTREIEAVVDTGFSEFLTVPAELAMELGLAFGGVTPVVLADGVEQGFRHCILTVMWNSRPRSIRAHVTDGTPLIGMSLLHGHRLVVDVVEGGVVEVAGLGQG